MIRACVLIHLDYSYSVRLGIVIFSEETIGYLFYNTGNVLQYGKYIGTGQ